ncbi:MAG: DmsE family decaheme c-type cytochrome [Nitrosomonas sp.]|nr:MAG: DmsE family decaheme c-type cytochrome [Nitrosomonas sp.]HMU63947.1 DmsE family decaheme c-type cytochrome [Nitrosomonas sp.]HMV12652.1 DmsE family decaheme c-type cytochrome [Nitrosomonas sp.]HMW19451.1 DmsE family decaheme c-type cytochrome [Nitrosomonas sp.]HMW69699.1 DmsE family decaheme c-type cytochrome [Nitrosomonas sp.]
MSRQIKKGLLHLLPMLVLALALGISPNSEAKSASEDADDESERGIVLRKDRECTDCHDESSEYPILAIGKTKHGTTADSRTPDSCKSCHGESNDHLDGETTMPMPSITFGKNSKNPIDERNQICLNCHQGGKRMHWLSSTHANRDTACTACHQIHAAQDKVRDRIAQAEVCFACHKEQRAQINRPSRHPIREGKVVCSDCHNPHGSAGPSKMIRDSVNETCFSCHMEKRGPFIYNHPPVQENCAICHNPHGTTAPNLLKVRSPFLCEQCHEPNTHQSSPATLTGYYRRNTLARGCMNCHTQIHGSNNPENIRNEEVFQR